VGASAPFFFGVKNDRFLLPRRLRVRGNLHFLEFAMHRLTLPDGSRAVYDSGNRLIAQEINGVWYRPDGFTEITDKQLTQVFERLP
jgi:hypothetical protein